MAKPLRLLLVEDNPLDAELVIRELRRGGFDPVWQRVDTEAAYVEHLSPELDIILSDYRMPQFDGFRALELLRQQERDIPFILISGTIGEETAVEAMKLGASDYLLKDRLVRLGPAIEQALTQNRLRRERKQAENASKDLLERLQVATKAAETGIWDLDLRTGEATWDEQMFALFGEKPGTKPIGVDQWFALMHTEDISKCKKVLQEVQDQGLNSFDIEFRIVRADDGRERIIRSMGMVTRDSKGVAQRIIGSHRDVTKSRTREQQLAEALAHEKDLSEKARAGDHAKSEFLAVMSHEVRTPMNGIIGFAEILSQTPDLPKDCENYVSIIRQSGEALLRILDDILDFSRLEAGRLQVETTVFSPREVLENISNLLSNQLRDKNLSLVIAVDKATPNSLEGDADRLRQILLNLIGNAIKFTDRGAITVNLKPLPGEASHFEFSVRDTGVGIPPRQLERIFKPFTQADSSISRRHGGTGLGLGISRHLTELLGGTLTVTSEVGRGSVFSFSIPLKVVSDGLLAPRPVERELLDKSFAAVHPLEVLIVEDDKINLKLIKTLLRRLGYDPILAVNGREAVTRVQEKCPNCILMDLQMPEMDGIEATKMIRDAEPARNAGNPPIFISALTANIFPADRQRCFDVGMNGYLNKPVKLAEIAGMLRLAGERQAQSAPKN